MSPHSPTKPSNIFSFYISTLFFIALVFVLISAQAQFSPWADDWIFISRSQNSSDAWHSFLSRISNWSPRLFSEATIFFTINLSRKLSLPAGSLTNLLLITSTFQSVGILFLPCISRLNWKYVIRVVPVSALILWWGLYRSNSYYEVLFWGAGCSAYLPAISAWTSTFVLSTIWIETLDNYYFISLSSQLFIGSLFWDGAIVSLATIPPLMLIPLICKCVKYPTAEAPNPLRLTIIWSILLTITIGFYAKGAISRIFFMQDYGKRGLPPSDIAFQSINISNFLGLGHTYYQLIALGVLIGLLAYLVISFKTIGLAQVGALNTVYLPKYIYISVVMVAESLIVFLSQKFLLGINGIENRHNTMSSIWLFFGLTLATMTIITIFKENIKQGIKELACNSFYKILLISTFLAIIFEILKLSPYQPISDIATGFKYSTSQHSFMKDLTFYICNPKHFAKELPYKSWNKSSVDAEILATSFGNQRYMLKIIKGILVANKAEFITVSDHCETYPGQPG